MTTLYLDRRDLALKLEGRALVIYAAGERQGTFPLHLIETVVMRSAVSLESSLLARLCDAGIHIVAFGGRGAHKVALVHGRGHNDGARRIGQYRRYDDLDWRLGWSRQLVRGKLRRQHRLLRRAQAERADLRHPLHKALGQLENALLRCAATPRVGDEPAQGRQLDPETDLLEGTEIPFDEAPAAEPELSDASSATAPGGVETLRGIEGAAALAYFSAFTRLFAPELKFTQRNRRPPRDPVNAVLSLAYTMLHHEAVRACQIAGLDPIIGYYHELSYGRESLACDLIEPLRPAVDDWTWQQFRERNLRADHFSREGDGCLLGKAGRMRFYPAFERFTRPHRRLLRRITRALAARLIRIGQQRP